MAKPQYRLQTLLEIRERTEKEKKDQLADSKKNLQKEQQKADDLRKEHQEMKDRRTAQMQENSRKMQSGEMGIEKFLAAERYVKRLEQEIEDFKSVIKEQDKKVIFAEQEVEWATEELIKATQEFKALEKHKEKAREEHFEEEKMMELKKLDEVASQRYFRQQQEHLEEEHQFEDL